MSTKLLILTDAPLVEICTYRPGDPPERYAGWQDTDIVAVFKKELLLADPRIRSILLGIDAKIVTR